MEAARCYFMIMPSLCTPTNEGSESTRDARAGRRTENKLALPCTHVGGWVVGCVFVGLSSFLSLFLCLLSDTALLFQPTGTAHPDRMVIFIVIIALNLRVHL